MEVVWRSVSKSKSKKSAKKKIPLKEVRKEVAKEEKSLLRYSLFSYQIQGKLHFNFTNNILRAAFAYKFFKSFFLVYRVLSHKSAKVQQQPAQLYNSYNLNYVVKFQLKDWWNRMGLFLPYAKCFAFLDQQVGEINPKKSAFLAFAHRQ